MDEYFVRTKGLLGDAAFEKLKNSRICIFGCGGVGSYVLEALARCGVGNITIVDADIIDVSNINRQIIALTSTIGMDKVQVARERVMDINPSCNVTALKMFYDKNNNFPLDFDYVIDAIDSVPSKLFLIQQAKEQNVPIICSMGTGNKLNVSMFQVSDISKTSYCPLAKKLRYELKKVGINHLKVVYSKEEVQKKSVPPMSIAFVPSSAGLLIASEVVQDIITSK